MREHYKNNHQMLTEVFDHELGAIRTVPHQNQEFAIAVSHNDNDSVGTVAVQQVVTEGDHSCVGMRRVCLFSSGVCIVSVSPSLEGEDFIQILQKTEAGISDVKEICAMRIRVSSNAKVVMQG